jgi:hypothetical protein
MMLVLHQRTPYTMIDPHVDMSSEEIGAETTQFPIENLRLKSRL